MSFWNMLIAIFNLLAAFKVKKRRNEDFADTKMRIAGTLEDEKSTKSLFCCFYKKVENLNPNMKKHQINPNGGQIFYKTTD